MSVLLHCDCPNCQNTTLPEAKLGRPAAPRPWHLMVNEAGRFIVGCSDEHLMEALKATVKCPA